MSNVLTLILGGGRGERLYPLTKHRAKPALPLAGKYRLIDIPVSNAINSGMSQIFVLTQFNSASLNRHIADTYRFPPFMRGFVDVLAAQQTPPAATSAEATAPVSRLPLRGWALELARRWNGGTYSLFLLHGNIFDLFPVQENSHIRYLPLKSFLCRRLFVAQFAGPFC